ncbi:MAG: FAD-binding protein [Candidatus Berkelbacteria bacterium]|nr:MAG: FAD-binding protein [Candidatus Berkelbacteria bacterium]QQG51486.1 MAG: FAD-binding protein [Candidatus Berkelbacteria bacterium]
MSIKFTKNSRTSESINSKFRSRFAERFLNNQPLALYVSASVGGVSEYVVIATSPEDLTDAAEIAVENKLEYAVIGGGTGTLPSEVGFPGLVIVNRSSGISFTQGSSVVTVSSGTTNQALLTAAASKNLGGIEFLSNVPGSIGGAVVSNATVGNLSISAHVKDVTCWVTDGEEHKIVTITGAELQFKPYDSLLTRPSIFPPVILNVKLQFALLPQEEIVRRLHINKARSALVNLSQPQVGSLTRPAFEAQPSLHPAGRKLRVLGLKFNPTTGIATATGRVGSSTYRELIEQLRQLAAGYGIELEERMSYLGYWPSKEEDNAPIRHG